MNGWDLLFTGWDFHLSVVIGCLLLAAGYLWAVHFRLDGTTLFFLSGVVIMFIALVSPLDTLGDEALFSAHMAQHILIALVAPAFYVLGLPRDLASAIVRWPPGHRAEQILGNPWVAWSLGTFTLFAWHIPFLYNATLASKPVHIFEHLTFLVTGTIFWWPIFSPLVQRRLAPLPAIIYLLLGALANGVLGIIFTLAITPFYQLYAHPGEEHGLLLLLRNEWGLNPVADQQLGGAFMWVFGSVIFFWAIMVMVTRWLREAETNIPT